MMQPPFGRGKEVSMQMLTGHGIFNNYRVRINKETDDKCWDCDASPVDAKHVLLRCPR